MTRRFIDIDSDEDGHQGLTIDLNGDVGLAGASVFVDRSAIGRPRLGIGTTIPQEELHISAASRPAIRFEDVAFSQIWEMESGIGEFRITDITAAERPFKIELDAGTDTLVVDSDERVGIGTEAPSATLEVTKADGTSRILVDENAKTTANRTLIQLENNGRPQIQLSNTASGVNWTTGMGSDDAYIIRRGANEYRFTKGGRVRWFQADAKDPIFDFNNNGNLTIAGTLTESSDVNAKRDVLPVDGAALLARVAALPVSTWTYRADALGARHLGPMAQDFHAAFGLGANDTSISPRDVAGVALAAVQELLRQKDAEIATLVARLAAVEARLARID